VPWSVSRRCRICRRDLVCRGHHLGRAESPGLSTSSGNVRPATTALASCSSRPSRARPLRRRVATSWNASRAISRSTHLGRALGYCLCGCEELIERWAYGAGRHGASVSAPHAPVSEYGGRSANAGSQACAPTVQQLLRRSVGPFGDRLLPRPPPECSLISTRRVVDVVLKPRPAPMTHSLSAATGGPLPAA
jgi:hypothetical protein